MASFKSIIKGIWSGFQTVEKVAEPIVETLLPASKPIFALLDPIIGNIANDVVTVEANAGPDISGLQKFAAVAANWQSYEATLNSILAVEGKRVVSDNVSFTAGTNALVEALRQYSVFRGSIRIEAIPAPVAAAGQ